jgi:flagellar protein FlaI
MTDPNDEGEREEPPTNGGVQDPDPGETNAAALGVEGDGDLPGGFEPLATLDPPHTDEQADLPVPTETVDEAAEVREAILGDVKAYFAELAPDEPAEEPADSAATRWLSLAREMVQRTEDVPELALPDDEYIEEGWFDFDYLAGYEEVERYWVNEPYSYVTLLFDPEEKTYRYQVVEPELTAFEEYVRDDLIRVIRNNLMYREISAGDDREAVFARQVERIVAEHAATVTDGTVRKLFYYFLRDFVGYGRIDPMMRDESLEDISCNGVDSPVFVYHRTYRDLRTNVTFDAKRLNSLVVRLSQRAGKNVSVSNPLIDATLPDGSRIQLTLGSSVSSRGSNFTIRKFSAVPYSPVDLIRQNTFSVEQMAYFWLAIENNMSLVFAGGTGSGKTTSMNAVSFFIPPDAKVVSIEDTREVTLPHDNWIQSVTRQGVGREGQGEVTTYQLLQAALRQRPEYLLVGEIRTEQRVALTFFQAIGTGHTAYTTIHADSLESALARLENPPLSVPAQMIRNLDIVSIQRQIYKGDRRVRRNERVGEIVPGDAPGSVDTHTVFSRDAVDDVHEQVGDSGVLDRIAAQRGWSEEEVQAALADRERVLSYLLEEGVTDYADVAGIIHAFARDDEAVLDAIEDDTLDPESVEGDR